MQHDHIPHPLDYAQHISAPDVEWYVCAYLCNFGAYAYLCNFVTHLRLHLHTAYQRPRCRMNASEPQAQQNICAHTYKHTHTHTYAHTHTHTHTHTHMINAHMCAGGIHTTHECLGPNRARACTRTARQNTSRREGCIFVVPIWPRSGRAGRNATAATSDTWWDAWYRDQAGQAGDSCLSVSVSVSVSASVSVTASMCVCMCVCVSVCVCVRVCVLPMGVANRPCCLIYKMILVCTRVPYPISTHKISRKRS